MMTEGRRQVVMGGDGGQKAGSNRGQKVGGDRC